MNIVQNFSLTNDLFENVILFQADHVPVFMGYAIQQFLTANKINCQNLLSENITCSGVKLTLKNIMAQAFLKDRYTSFTFLDCPEEFLLFSVSEADKRVVVLGLREIIEKISKMERELEDSLKELQCLYNVSKQLDSTKDLPEALRKCAIYVQEGFDIPEDIIVQIEIKKKKYGPQLCEPDEIQDMLFCDILANNERTGEIRVYSKNSNGFLPDEHKLVNEIAGKISRVIEKNEKEKNLEKQQKILLAKNEVLLRLTKECNRSREKLRTFFSAFTEKIVVVDEEFNIIISNKEEIGDSGKCYGKLFNLQEPCADCPAAITFRTADNSAFEREESDKFLRLMSYPIFGAGQTVDRVLEVCRDITSQKKMEFQLLQSYKLASLGKLVSGVAHEINNPNTFILGNLKIVQESLPDIFPILDEYYEKHPDLKIARLGYTVFKENITVLVADMIEGANRTKKIVTDLRNFAQKDEGNFTDDVDLNDIIENNLTIPTRHAKRNARLEIELEQEIPAFKGSITKIEQVISNLILNASDAIEGDNGCIKIKTAFDVQANEVVLIVSDNGCGMDEKNQKRIFDPFFTTKRNRGGTGLGLSISYSIVKDHGGKIDVESRIGGGTKFIIRIPVKNG
ncbi:MAG: hypothetical protein HY965_00505 [Ignavibacteriales bacterium]|nr:hypothetical protein [Ignavibacteriales bacterium]